MESKEIISSPASLSSSARWWGGDTVAVVTGANKGIGFAVVKRFAELGLTAVLTARDVEKGKKATEKLRDRGLENVRFFPLDVTEADSIKTFVSWLQTTFGGLDILVNNAGVSFNEIHENSVGFAETVIKTNFQGPRQLTESLLPLFRLSSSSSRILNISSRLGSINKVRNLKIKATLQNERLSEEEIQGVVDMFVQDVKEGRWRSQGWPEIWTDYSVSKLALNAYARVLAKRFQGRRLSVNCFCPGFTRTSLTRGQGTHSRDAAAEVAVSLALLPPHRLSTGRFFLGFGPYNKSRL
ncbi:NAD(P)-binding Rossmann-fold superfamily protein isoform 2 [Hibiscus syriacus]|uniref:NAD(P)-binding Rossmann-fold superfamily protein isoform 2 n=1 Tax=Hibiscus syriacus TaxID=106335 RepID=A0A6A2Y9I4_HIBSY|nr:salutaridine reductase-like [Hibiscus syriacus]KAE8673896.1 NAD(P)-binding Rossmann-fold superfamily protein isoform 2 [Hibiscus syriacus]